MAIEVGQRIPDVTLKRMTGDGVKDVSTRELFAGKRAVLFAVPGAFTPTCSDSHLPGYLAWAQDLRSKGVELIACVAVNDAFVMGAWGKERGVGDDILMLADGNGELTRALGLELDLDHYGLGQRSRRYAAVLDDGVVTVLHVEPSTGLSVSSAEAILAALQEKAR